VGESTNRPDAVSKKSKEETHQLQLPVHLTVAVVVVIVVAIDLSQVKVHLTKHFSTESEVSQTP
jgi:hypothetical protein